MIAFLPVVRETHRDGVRTPVTEWLTTALRLPLRRPWLKALRRRRHPHTWRRHRQTPALPLPLPLNMMALMALGRAQASPKPRWRSL